MQVWTPKPCCACCVKFPSISGVIMGQPEIYLNGVGDAFDDKGELSKESLQAVLKQYIEAYAAFVQKHNT